MKRCVFVGAAALLGALVALGTAAHALDKGQARAVACAQKSSAAEAAICMDRGLVRLDAQVAEAYQSLRRRLSPARFRSVRQDQQRWRSTREQCGAREACLTSSYRERLTALEQALSALAPVKKGS